MAGIQRLMFHLSYIICSLYLVSCSRLDVQQVNNESTEIDNLVYKTKSTGTESDSESNLNISRNVRNHTLAGGPVSIDCLRCLCLKLSNCLPIGCVLDHGTLGCGYFRLTRNFMTDCGESDWRTCSNDLSCASKCVQNYMLRYAEKYKCFQNCEGYSREMAGGPNGCNNPNTVAFWENVQKIPGCKGVQ